MAFDQIATSVTIISSGLKGYQAISLTNFTRHTFWHGQSSLLSFFLELLKLFSFCFFF